SGALSLAQNGTNLTLAANDNAGHTGVSEPFTPGQTNAAGALRITRQPASQTVNAGNTATFTVVAPGGPFSYQWSLNGTALSDGGQVTGSATPTLKVSDVLRANTGSYAVMVSSGSAATSSVPAVLTVIDPAIL